MHQIAGKLTLGPLRRTTGGVDVGALLLVAPHQTFFGHDLQQLKNSCVLRGPALKNGLVNVADRRWPAAPKHRQDFKFGIRRPRWVGRFRRHIRRLYYDSLRESSSIFEV